MNQQFDYSKLLGRIKEKGYTLKTLAESINMSSSTMSIKLSNKAQFTQKDMHGICAALEIDAKYIGVYFFTPKVQKAEQ